MIYPQHQKCFFKHAYTHVLPYSRCITAHVYIHVYVCIAISTFIMPYLIKHYVQYTYKLYYEVYTLHILYVLFAFFLASTFIFISDHVNNNVNMYFLGCHAHVSCSIATRPCAGQLTSPCLCCYSVHNNCGLFLFLFR